MPRHRLLSLLVASATALALAPAADAAAPTPKTYTVVPATSIGGVRLGMSYKDALKAWGPGSTCQTEDDAYAAANPGQTLDRSTYLGTCSWKVSDQNTDGYGQMLIKDGKVRNVSIQGAQKKSYFPSKKGPIGKFRTKKGKLHIASYIGNLSKYYKTQSEGYGVSVTTKNRSMGFSSSGGTIGSISLTYIGDV